MTRCHVLFALFLSFSSYAGTIEIVQWVPWNFIKDQYLSQKIARNFQGTNQELSIGELHPLISFNASVEGTMSDVLFSDEGIKASHNLSSVISFDKISIDQILTRNVDGNVFQVRVKAECTPFTIRISQFSSQALLGYKEETEYWAPELAWMNLSIPSWELSDFTCSGIGGLGDEIKSQIQAALKNPNAFQDVLTQVLGDEIKNSFTTMWTSLLRSTDITIASMSRPDGNGAFIHGLLAISGNKNIVLGELKSSDYSPLGPQLVFSEEGFTALLEDKINKMIPQHYDLEQVSAFKSLMSSKLKRFFAWPDLLRFNSSTPFYFSTDVSQSQLTLKQTSQGNYTAWFNTNGKLTTVMGSAPLDYLLFGIGLNSSLSVKLNNGVLTLATGSDATLNLAWSYGIIYQMIFRPDNRIALDILKSSLLTLFKNQSVSEPLPAIKIQGKELKLKNWKQNNGIITMDWL